MRIVSLVWIVMPLILFMIFVCPCAVTLGGGLSDEQVAALHWDFEADAAGGQPLGWLPATAGYEAQVTRQEPKAGEHCASLRLAEGRLPERFGNLAQSIDAEPYRGKRVRFRAAVRIDAANSTDRAQLWFRVDRFGGQRGFFDNMADRPIRAQRWRHYEIVGDVAEDARHINFGLILFGSAPVWLDDVSLEVLGDTPPTTVEPPRPLTDRGLANIKAFSRLLGYIRYFHPSDEAASADWTRLAISGIRKVESAADATDLASRLQTFFEPVAPTLLVFRSIEAPPEAAIPRDELVTRWEHRGLGRLGSHNPGIYHSRRARGSISNGRLPTGWAAPTEPMILRLGGGVTCAVAATLYCGADGHTLPKAPRADIDASLPSVYSGNDRATRLAAVLLCWNVMQHFYPYFDVVETDWEGELETAIQAAAVDSDEVVFTDTLARMISAIRDGHGYVTHLSGQVPGYMPLLWDWIENQLVITAVFVGQDAEAAKLRSGAVVRKIEDQSVQEALSSAEALTSASTTQYLRFKALRRMRMGRRGKKVDLEVRNPNGDIVTVTLSYGAATHVPKEHRPPKIHEVKPGIFYVDADRITDKDFREALTKLKRAEGIIFDFRGYPSRLRPNTFLPHLVKEPVTSPQWHIPFVTQPDRLDIKFHQTGRWRITPREPYLEARRMFLIDGRAVSYAESCLGIIEHYRLGALVGGPTAGTNGNINPIVLPGGYRVIWTGMKVLKHDGSRHHGVGILPTVPVQRTIRGAMEERDELLDKAIAILKPRNE